MNVSFTVHSDGIDPHMLTRPCKHAETVLAVQAMKDTEPYVPMLTGSLGQRTRTMGNLIVYPGPYARYLWAGKVMKNSITGKGPRYIPEVGYRWPLGATLVPTERDLVFTKTFHPQAQAHWFEASKKKNLHKWEQVVKKAVANEL